MNQQFNAPGLSLPQPAPQVPASSSPLPVDPATQDPGIEPHIQQIVGQEPLSLAQEQYAPQQAQPVAPQLSPQPAPQFIAPPAPVQPAVINPGVAISPPVASASPLPQPAPVTDDELDDSALDEEWVHKAKAIVEQTQDDPYAESRALSQVKADYLQRRYGKKIKVSDQSS